MMDQKNLFLAIALSIAIVLGFHYFSDKPRVQQQQTQQQQREQAQAPAPGTVPAAPGAPAAPGTGAAPPQRDAGQVLRDGKRVRIDSPRLSGSISLMGGLIDDVVLTGYRETVEPGSPNIRLLAPPGVAQPYYAEFGWTSAGGNGVLKLPDSTTAWTADRDQLTPEQPVTLSWDNGAGLAFTRTYALDRDYMLTVTQKVANTGAAPVTLYPYALVSRTGTPPVLGFFILHEGLLGVLDGKLREYTYSNMQEEKSGAVKFQSTGGWLGITDKYWLVALVPAQDEKVESFFRHVLRDKTDKYQVDYIGAARAVAPGASAEAAGRLFAGAKEVKLVNRHEEQNGIAKFSYAVDWGWFPFLTKPIFLVLDIFFGLLGNFGLAILLLTVIVKLVFFPLANKSYKSMTAMKKLQPQMMALREKYGEDRQQLNQAMMELYKREKVNPVSGCLPIVIQIPVFFALYKVLFVTIEMRHAPFYGWIKDLSAPDPTTIFNLFGLIPWTPPYILMVGVWPLIMGLTMWLQQKLNPQPPDPVQAKIFMLLPIFFTYLLSGFPAGLVIYWAWNNLLSIAQQWVIMRRAGVKA
ncbi:MAG: membrane protein insertase YidC [Rhodospirillales bacterium]